MGEGMRVCVLERSQGSSRSVPKWEEEKTRRKKKKKKRGHREWVWSVSSHVPGAPTKASSSSLASPLYASFSSLVAMPLNPERCCPPSYCIVCVAATSLSYVCGCLAGGVRTPHGMKWDETNNSDS